MKHICRLEEFRPGELERIRKTLRQRYGVGKRGNIIEIAFGAAEANGQLDLTRPDAICFYVRHKRTPRARVDRIPKKIEIRLRRGKRWVLVCMPTDVIDLGPRKIRPTGRMIKHVSGNDSGTAGCIVAWKLPGERLLTWGVLSVGHVFSHVVRVPQTQQRVLIESATTPVHLFRGTLLARSKPRDGIDAALVLVKRATLVRAQLMPENVSTGGKRVRPVESLETDRTNPGFTFPQETKIPFVVGRYLVVSDILPELGSVRNVIEANARGGAFAKGSSGSLWAVERQVACLQHGGLSPLFSRGWGQSLETILAWIVAKIAAINRVPKRDVDLRLIRVI